MAELADARDSKSRSLHRECGFDPHFRHHLTFTMETSLHFEGDLEALLKHVKSSFPQIDWSIHESEAYFTGRYILGKSGTQRITIEVVTEGEEYELALT